MPSLNPPTTPLGKAAAFVVFLAIVGFALTHDAGDHDPADAARTSDCSQSDKAKLVTPRHWDSDDEEERLGENPPVP